jgi:hypothetical protein
VLEAFLFCDAFQGGKERPMFSAFAKGLGPTLLITAMTAGPAFADTGTYIVKGSDRQATPPRGSVDTTTVERTPLADPQRRDVQIVHRQVVEPAATASRSLRQQPTYPDLVEVQVGGTTILVDPYRELAHKPWGGIDENHSLIKAQRQADVPRPLPQGYIVYGSDAGPSEASDAPAEPAAVIPVPEHFRESEPAKPKRTAPQPPALPEQDQAPRLMARSSD